MKNLNKGIQIEYNGKIDKKNKEIKRRMYRYIHLVNEEITFYPDNKFYFFTTNDFLKKFFFYTFKNKKNLEKIIKNEKLNDFPDFYMFYKNQVINIDVKSVTDFFVIKSEHQVELFNNFVLKSQGKSYFDNLWEIIIKQLDKHKNKEKKGINLFCIFINEMNIVGFRDLNTYKKDSYLIEKNKLINEWIKEKYKFIDGIIFCVLPNEKTFNPLWLNKIKTN